MLLVSHDRYFVNQVADHVLVVEPDRVRAIEGNYTAYQQLVGRLAREGAPASAPLDARKASRKAGSRSQDARKDQTAARRPRKFPYRKGADLEKEILEREARLEHLHAALLDPETLRDGRRVRQMKSEIADVMKKLRSLYAHWEEAVEG